MHCTTHTRRSNPLSQNGGLKIEDPAPEPDEAMVQAGCTAVVAIKVCVYVLF